MRPATESGSAAACSAATRPPIELPTRMAGDAPTARRKLTHQPPVALDVRRSGARQGVSPCPTRSRATTLECRLRRGPTAVQLRWDPPRPCTPTRSGPSAGPPMSQVVDRSVDVDRAGPGAGWPRWGHPDKATGRRAAEPPSGRPSAVGAADQAGRKSSSSR